MKNFLAKYKFILLLLIPLALYFAFGSYHLTKFETADEHYWYGNPIDGRIHDYWRAIANFDLMRTRINDKPGITLAWVSGLGMLTEGNPEERVIERGSFYRVFDPKRSEEINLAFRLPLFIFNGLFIFYFFWVIRKLTENDWIALLASTLILLNPILLGISRIVNPDSMLWVFSAASILSFMLYLRNGRLREVAFTALFLGLALLSKYAAVILFPFYFALIGFHFLYNYEAWGQEQLSRKVLRNIGVFWFIVIEAVTVFAFLMPAVFLEINFLYKGTFGFRGSNTVAALLTMFVGANAFLISDAVFLRSRILGWILRRLQWTRRLIRQAVFLALAGLFLLALVNWSFGGNFLGVKDVAFDAGREPVFTGAKLWHKILLEFRPMVFSLTPLVLFTVILYWVWSAIKRSAYESHAFVLSFFLLVFYAGVVSQKLLVHIRYSAILYPLLMTLAAMGLYELLRFEKMREGYKLVAFAGVIACSVVNLALIQPFYFNYQNNLLPKSHSFAGAWGYGGYEAAQYLNALPDARHLTVWTDYTGFCSFFVGRCTKATEVNKAKPTDQIDYFVTTRRGSIQNRKLWKKLKLENDERIVWELLIDGREKNYIRVMKANFVEAVESQPIESEQNESEGE